MFARTLRIQTWTLCRPKPTKATLVPGIRVRTLPDAKCGASKVDSYEMRIFTYATRT